MQPSHPITASARRAILVVEASQRAFAVWRLIQQGSSNVGILRSNYRPLTIALYEHLYHHAIAGLPWSTVSIPVTPHPPAHVSNRNIRSDEFDLCTCHRSHAPLELHGMCTCLEGLELRTTLEHLSGHIHETNILGNQDAQCLNVIPIPGIIPTGLDFPYRSFIRRLIRAG
jgi:hypothetical protein